MSLPVVQLTPNFLKMCVIKFDSKSGCIKAKVLFSLGAILKPPRGGQICPPVQTGLIQSLADVFIFVIKKALWSKMRGPRTQAIFVLLHRECRVAKLFMKNVDLIWIRRTKNIKTCFQYSFDLKKTLFSTLSIRKEMHCLSGKKIWARKRLFISPKKKTFTIKGYLGIKIRYNINLKDTPGNRFY